MAGSGASLRLGCLLLLWGAAAGGADTAGGSVVEVEVEVGKTAKIQCDFSPREESSYDEISWVYIDRQTPKRICYMHDGQVFPEDMKYKGRVEMEKDFTLVISQVLVQDARIFMCQVKAGGLVRDGKQTQLHVYKTPEAPEIQVNDVGISVTSTELPKIAVCTSKNGFPAPNITWYKNSNVLWHNDKSVSISSTLTKESSGLYTVSSTLYSSVSREDRHALYHCQASYRLLGTDHTMASEKVTATLFYPTEKLKLEVQSPPGEVQEGDDVTLHCEGDGNPPPEYTLLIVEETGKEQELPSSNGELTLHEVTREDSGRYLCRTLDLESMATLEATVELTVNYLEGIKITPEGPIQPHQGETLTLSCDAQGSKPLEFRWKKEKHGKLVGQGKQLTLSNITHESSGRYSCEVAAEGLPGLARSSQVDIAVHGKPQVSSKDSLVPVQENEVVTLMCKAAALPEPSIAWSVSGTVQNHSDHHRVLSNLTVQVTPELLQSGITCTATNKFGSSKHHIKLQLRTRTPAPPPGSTTVEPIKKEQRSQERKGVIIVAVIVCILVIAVVGAVLYFLHKKGKIPCGRTGKQAITRPDARKEEIVVEVKSDKLPEEAGLLQGANGEKRPAGDQAEKYIDLRN